MLSYNTKGVHSKYINLELFWGSDENCNGEIMGYLLGLKGVNFKFTSGPAFLHTLGHEHVWATQKFLSVIIRILMNELFIYL